MISHDNNWGDSFVYFIKKKERKKNTVLSKGSTVIINRRLLGVNFYDVSVNAGDQSKERKERKSHNSTDA